MSPALFSPLRVGNKVARNRLFVPPMCQYTLENRDGVANYETAQHYGALARGGWGAIIVEATAGTGADRGRYQSSRRPGRYPAVSRRP